MEDFVQTVYPGTTDFVGDNAPDLKLEDGSIPVRVSVGYDRAEVPAGGNFSYPLGEKSGNMTVAVGFMSLVASQDTSGKEGWPLIRFEDGEFAGVDFEHVFQTDVENYILFVDGTNWSIVLDEKGNPEVMRGTLGTQPIEEEEEE